jgi:hypothetical protein
MPRVRTSIPSRWDGEWPSSTPSPGQHRREEDGTIYQQYELYHQHAFSAATQFYPLNNLLPAPRGYEQYSFENYPPVRLSVPFPFLSFQLLPFKFNLQNPLHSLVLPNNGRAQP